MKCFLSSKFMQKWIVPNANLETSWCFIALSFFLTHANCLGYSCSRVLEAKLQPSCLAGVPWKCLQRVKRVAPANSVITSSLFQGRYPSYHRDFLVYAGRSVEWTSYLGGNFYQDSSVTSFLCKIYRLFLEKSLILISRVNSNVSKECILSLENFVGWVEDSFAKCRKFSVSFSVQ